MIENLFFALLLGLLVFVFINALIYSDSLSSSRISYYNGKRAALANDVKNFLENNETKLLPKRV